MTREQYLELKSELKEKSSILRSLKNKLKNDMRQNSIPGVVIMETPVWKTHMEVNNLKKDFRTKHVFMSLLRGKSRNQIESNFETKEMNSLLRCLENDIRKLCEKYELECDNDEHLRVISITRHWIQNREAA